MYVCLECNSKFEIPKEIPAEVFYGVDSEFDYRYGYKVQVCPKCESNDIEKG